MEIKLIISNTVNTSTVKTPNEEITVSLMTNGVLLTPKQYKKVHDKIEEVVNILFKF